MISFSRVSKQYGKQLVFVDASFQLNPGEHAGLVGPNGSGKTTLFRVLATLLRPRAGRVWVDGLDVSANASRVRERVGYLPDLSGLYENLTAAEYLSFYARSYRIPLRRRRQLADELLELVDLTDHRNDAVTSLSRGLQQRLGLARCLIHDPSVLLLDEPASGMDSQSRRELRDVLRELTRLGKTTLVASHILPELAELCTDVGVLCGGRLVAEGAPVEIAALAAQTPQLRIELLDAMDREAAARLLEAHPACRWLRQDGDNVIQAGFEGGPAEQAELLNALVGREFRIVRFGTEPPSLEDACLALTVRKENSE